MSSQVQNSLADSTVRDAAIRLVRLMGVDSYREYAQAVRQWIFQHVTLIGEPDEMLIPPAEAIRKIEAGGTFYGDCDDTSMLAAALFRAVGLPTRFRAVFPNEDGSFSHVFTEVEIEAGKWLPIDATIPGYPAWAGDSIMMEV